MFYKLSNRQKKTFNNKVFFYSVRKASTGSFLDAIFDGINPAITVNDILITTNVIPPTKGNFDILDTPVIFFMIILIGIFKIIMDIKKCL